PPGLEASDEIFLPARGDWSVAAKRASGEPRVVSWLPQLPGLSNSRLDYLQRVVERKRLPIKEGTLRQFLAELFTRYITEPGRAFVEHYLHRRASRESGHFTFQLVPMGWQAVPSAGAGPLYRCSRCGVRARRHVSGACPTYRCLGDMIVEQLGETTD